MADPMELELMVQAPGGQPSPTRVIVDPGASPQDTFAKVQAKGLNIVSVGAIKPVPPAPAPAQAQPPGLLQQAVNALPVAREAQRAMTTYPNASSAALQVGTGLLGGGPIGAAAAGLAPYVVKNRGLPSLGEATGVALGEALPIVGRLGESMLRGGATQALKGSQLAIDAARTVGPIYQRPTARAGQVLLEAKGIIKGAAPAMKEALENTLSTWGLDITKMSEEELLATVRKNPERVGAALEAFNKASGRNISVDMHRLWISDVLHGSAKGVREGARNAKGLLFEPGGGILLNGQAVAEAWNKLSAEGQATFGQQSKRAFDGLVAAVGKLDKAPQGIRRLAVGGGDTSRIPLLAPKAAIERVLNYANQHMLQSAGAAYEAYHHPVAAATIAGGVGVVKLGKRALREVFDRVLSTTAGVQWLTQGIEMQAKGLPTVMIADTLSRTAMRSAPFLMSLGLEPPQGAPGANQGQPGNPPGFQMGPQ